MTRLDGKNENLRFTNRGKYSKIAPGNEVLPWETKTAEIRLMTSVRKSQGSPAFFALHIEESPVARPMISRTIRRKKYVNIPIIHFSGRSGHGGDLCTYETAAHGEADRKRIRYEKEHSADDTAGASCDDIFVLFSTFSGMAQGGSARLMDFVNIPVSIISGVIVGEVAGWLLSLFFETAYAKEHYVRNSMKVIIVLGVSFLLMSVETWLKPFISVSGFLAVVSMACVLKLRSIKEVSARLSEKFGKLWLAAEVLLFVMVGAAVDIRYTVGAGLAAVVMIAVALFFRTVGVLLCLVKTALNWKERLFCVIAYLPKATVQAAIGSVPMAMGLPCGQIVLSVAVMAILITAPLGAFGMDSSFEQLLGNNTLIKIDKKR